MILAPLLNSSITEQLHTATFTPCFTKEECDEVLTYLVPAPIVGAIAEGSNPKVRNSRLHNVQYNEATQWLYQKVMDRVARNNTLYDFDISGMYEGMNIMEYGEGGHYDWHLDIGPGLAAHRKLSVIVQLSDPKDYTGGEVLFNAGKERELPKDRGQIAIFPSYILHKVNPVLTGTRYSLVAWVSGQRRFR